MNLLKNSIKIKIDKQDKYIDKIRAIVLIQIKIIVKYENFMTIVLSEVWGNSPRSNTCKKYLTEYRLFQSYNDVVYSNLTIQSIALRHGFSNTKSFITEFKKVYKITPHQYRKLYQKKTKGAVTKGGFLTFNEALQLLFLF